jgi:ketosteroid isomerase-like protein
VANRERTIRCRRGGERYEDRIAPTIRTSYTRREESLMTEQKMGFDFEAMRRAIEGLDADALVGLYADDAELRVVNKSTTPSSPRELRGKEEITEYLRDVCGRAMTHHIENEVVGEDRVAFNEACEYPDGTKVLAATTLDVRDGKVVRQVNVEAWDE